MHQSYLTTLLLLGLPSTLAHSVISNAFVDGKDQGDGQGKYIRSPPSTDPIKDISSPEINCNVKGATAVSTFISANAGDRLTFEWRHNTRGDDIIDPSHSGPIITYITPFVEGQPSGGVWTKIHQEGFDSATKKWAVDKLIAQKGKWDFNLPAELKAGKYLVRQEIIALHEADTRFDQDPKRGAQFYPQCVQVEVGGSGTREPDQAFNLNTGYSVSDPGILFNMFTKFDSYPIPGPPVWDGSSAASSGSTGNSNTATGRRAVAAPVGPEGEKSVSRAPLPSTFATLKRAALPTPRLS